MDDPNSPEALSIIKWIKENFSKFYSKKVSKIDSNIKNRFATIIIIELINYRIDLENKIKEKSIPDIFKYDEKYLKEKESEIGDFSVDDLNRILAECKVSEKKYRKSISKFYDLVSKDFSETFNKIDDPLSEEGENIFEWIESRLSKFLSKNTNKLNYIDKKNIVFDVFSNLIEIRRKERPTKNQKIEDMGLDLVKQTYEEIEVEFGSDIFDFEDVGDKKAKKIARWIYDHFENIFGTKAQNKAAKRRAATALFAEITSFANTKEKSKSPMGSLTQKEQEKEKKILKKANLSEDKILEAIPEFYGWLIKDLGDNALNFDASDTKKTIEVAKWIKNHLTAVLSEEFDPDLEKKLAVVVLIRLKKYKKD